MNEFQFGESDIVLKLALYKHFYGKSWNFTLRNNLPNNYENVTNVLKTWKKTF